jgi:hypothetical protein
MEETLMGITHLQLHEGKQPAYLQTGLRTVTRGYQAATTWSLWHLHSQTQKPMEGQQHSDPCPQADTTKSIAIAKRGPAIIWSYEVVAISHTSITALNAYLHRLLRKEMARATPMQVVEESRGGDGAACAGSRGVVGVRSRITVTQSYQIVEKSSSACNGPHAVTNCAAGALCGEAHDYTYSFS